MKRFTRQIVLWAAFALFPVAVQGQWIDDYQGVLNHGDIQTLDYQNPGEPEDRVVSDFSLNGSRVYVGPYQGAFSGVTGASFSIICIDYQAYAGDQDVFVSSLGDATGPESLTQTRLGKADVGDRLERYRKAAYYASLFDSWQDYGSDRGSVWSAIHASIWTLMSTNSDEFISGSPSIQLAIMSDGAEANYSADGWYVLSGTGDDPAQEMLVRTRTATVPEPSTYLLMATGLFFLAVLGRKRRDQVEA